MENKHKVGFYKPCTGVMPSDKQRKQLEQFGCVTHDVLRNALDDTGRGNEVLCVVSPAVLGYKIPEIMNMLHERGATLYSLISEREYNCGLVSDVVAARDELQQRKRAYLKDRTGKAKGGRPPCLTKSQKNEIRDLVNSGMTRDKIMGKFGCSAATISRILNVQGEK